MILPFFLNFPFGHNFFRCQRIFADFGYVILDSLMYHWCKFQYYLFFPLKNLVLPVYIAHEVRSLAEGKRDIIYVNENCHNFFRCRRIFADFGYVILHNLKYYWCKFQYYLFFSTKLSFLAYFYPSN